MAVRALRTTSRILTRCVPVLSTVAPANVEALYAPIAPAAALSTMPAVEKVSVPAVVLEPVLTEIPAASLADKWAAARTEVSEYLNGLFAQSASSAKQAASVLGAAATMMAAPTVALCDAPEPWQMIFQDPATPIAQGIQDLHHDIMAIIMLILGFVMWMLFRTVYLFTNNPLGSQLIIHGTVIEVIWTCIPSIILLFIAVPSFALLYSMDEVMDPAITIKAIGHQWYWTYEYSDYAEDDGSSLVFDSYMIPEDDLEVGRLRLLEVDNRVVLPVNTNVRILLTAADVLHSWAVPSLGVKCDCVPGRLNQTSCFIKREGVFFGQCSELCGVNHGFMPIVVEGVPVNDYLSWIDSKLADA